MINFVICEDSKILRKEYEKIINQYMMNYDYIYNVVKFEDYDESFDEYVKKSIDFKIYILDIKTKTSSGIDAAKKIREVQNDWNSTIIIISGLKCLKYEVLSKRLMLMDFITKDTNYKKLLIECIDKSLHLYDERPNKLKYIYKKIIYNIEYKKIKYIKKEPNTKKSYIYTTDNKRFSYCGTLNNLLSLLDNRFIKTSRCSIVNGSLIVSYNQKTNELSLVTNEKFNDISRENKKKVFDYVRGLK